MSSFDVRSRNTNELVTECDAHDLVSQGMEYQINSAASRVKSETMAFSDNSPGYSYTVSSPMESTYNVADTGDVTLANFLSRPVQIYEREWPVSVPNLSDEINPWALFFDEPRIANRIQNYALMRCRLRIKVMINGNAFFYGRLLLAYNPWDGADQLTNTFRPLEQGQAVLDSQRPHVYLDPCESSGGELTLPFFYHKNNVEIPSREYADLGILRLRTLNNLKHANGADGSVNVNIFAWAEDVVLTAPTRATTDDFVSQADEYGSGPISKPAGVVARVASAIKNAPVIGPYARATEIAASAVSRIAGLAGYCRPNDITTIKSYKPTYLGNLANTNMEDTAQKLAVDVKQELTLDSRTVGLSGQDELDIRSISTRESYLTTFDWSTSDESGEGLWFSAVTPHLININSASPVDRTYLPAMAFASLPFRYWRGSINFRFQVVASCFHRGRIRVAYEPYDNRPDPNNFTVNHSRVVDIADEKDFTIKVGWGSATTYKKTPAGSSYEFERYGTNYTASDGNVFQNGTIGFYVFNKLTVPNSTIDNDIQVNVFVSTSDDFEVAGPCTSPMDTVSWWQDYVPPTAVEEEQETEESVTDLISQSNDESDIVESTTEASKPMQMQVDETMAAPSDVNDYSNHVFFGENIVSFRPLLKRYCYWHTVTPDEGSATGRRIWTCRLPAFPLPRGAMPGPGALHGDYGNIVKCGLMNYLAPAFTGWRGGVRWKATYDIGTTRSFNSEGSRFPVMVERGSAVLNGGITNVFTSAWDVAGDRISDALANQNRFSNGFGALAATVPNVNPTLEFEVPFYSSYRMLPTKSAWAQGFDQDTPPYFQVRAQFEIAEDNPEMPCYTAAAEDFNLFFFTGCPPIYFIQALSDG